MQAGEKIVSFGYTDIANIGGILGHTGAQSWIAEMGCTKAELYPFW